MNRPYTVIPTSGWTREEWLEARRTLGIGGSEASAIVGMSRYDSPMSVWLRKTGRIPQKDVGDAAEWGNILEPIVAEHWAKKTGRKIRNRKVMLRSIEWPWMLANVDRWVLKDETEEEALLEVKTGGYFRLKEWDDGRVPDEYAVQMQHYLAVTGYRRIYYAALIGGQHPIDGHIDRDEDAIAALVKLERDFWTLVENDTPPAVDGRDETADYLLSLYPDGDPSKQVTLPPDIFTRYDEAKMQADAAEERLNLVKNEARSLIGEAVRGVHGDRKVNWTNVPYNKFDTTRFKEEHPDLYAAYLNSGTTRRLTFS